MEDINKPKSPGESPSSESQEEDIIFPADEGVETGPFGKIKKRHLLLKLFGFVALVTLVFAIGHFTRPDTLDRALEKIKTLIAFGVEQVQPVKDTVSEKITEIIDTQFPSKEKPIQRIEGSSGEREAPKRKIKYWQAPMDRTFIRDKPGKSPTGMDLIPVYEGEADDTGDIRINPTMTQNIGVKTKKVRIRSLTREIRTIGRLTYDERKIHHIHTKYEGWIEKLHIDFTGQEVRQNDLMVEIYSPQLVSTQEEFLLAMKYSQSLKDSPFPEITSGADSLLESTRRRLELFDVAEHQIESLIREKKVKKTMHIHSPVRGFVIKLNAIHGMFIKPGMSLYTIADLSNIWVLVDIYEYELPWIQIGQEAEMSLSYYPGKKFSGKLTYIDPYLEPKTRTVKVRMEFANPKWELKPDMYANVTLKSNIAKEAVAVPEEAVIRTGAKDLVIVQTRKGRFQSREVVLGPQAQGYYQVLKGLKAGETVVTSSGFLIDSESRLKEAIGKLESPSREPSPGKKKRKMKPGKKTKTLILEEGKKPGGP